MRILKKHGFIDTWMSIILDLAVIVESVLKLPTVKKLEWEMKYWKNNDAIKNMLEDKLNNLTNNSTFEKVLSEFNIIHIKEWDDKLTKNEWITTLFRIRNFIVHWTEIFMSSEGAWLPYVYLSKALKKYNDYLIKNNLIENKQFFKWNPDPAIIIDSWVIVVKSSPNILETNSLFWYNVACHFRDQSVQFLEEIKWKVWTSNFDDRINRYISWISRC